MKKKFGEIECLLPEGDIVLRHKNSRSFLCDSQATLDLGGSNLWYIWACRILLWLGIVALTGLMGIAFYIWMWDSSPLTRTAEATVVGYDKKSQGAVVQYEFAVDGNTYSGQQYARSSERKWREDNATAEVIYLSFMPNSSKLKRTVERMDWSMFVLGPIMPVGFIVGGFLGARSLQRLARIEENATHVIATQPNQPDIQLDLADYTAWGRRSFRGFPIDSLTSRPIHPR